MSTNEISSEQLQKKQRQRLTWYIVAALAWYGAAVLALVFRNYLMVGQCFCIATAVVLSYTDWAHTPLWRRVLQILFLIGAIIFVIYQTPYHLS